MIDYRAWSAPRELHCLARAYAAANDNIQARAAYQEFLTLWKGADQDLPILKSAELEQAKLL